MSEKTVFEVKWSIENILLWFQGRDDTLYSPRFLAKPLANTSWKLSLSTNWHFEEKYICLTLHRDVESDGPDLISLNCELSFLAGDGSPIRFKARGMKFSVKAASHELNVKQTEILKERKEEYLLDGVMTVCCKMRSYMVSSMISKGEECLIRSVIGIKCLTLESSIENFEKIYNSSNVMVKFLSPSTDISLIFFDTQVTSDLRSILVLYTFKLRRIKIDCKSFRVHCCKLSTVDTDGKNNYIFNNSPLSTLLDSNKECELTYSFYEGSMLKFLQGNSLKLRLEISYSPGVESELIEYQLKNCEEPLIADQSTRNLSTDHSEKGKSSFSSDLQASEQEVKLSYSESERFGYKDSHFDAFKSGNVQQTTLRQDLSSLFDDRLFCDTKLQTDTEMFPAHRCVLSARSPVFKKMFTTDMKEKGGECVNVTDISSDTVRRMLQFLYTDCTGDLNMQSAKDLYIASDKYDIASLKQRCSSYMKETLCPANLCDVLVLADMHQDKELESAAHEYVLCNDEEVFHSDEWKLFMKNYSALAAYLMYLKCTKK